MVRAVSVILIGLILAAAGLILYGDVAGAGRAAIRAVTSKSLGSLAPGYAATRGGFRTYALLLAALGVAVTGAGLAPYQPLVGLALIALGVLGFLLLSVVAIAGEIRTLRGTATAKVK
jgi:hypothetical protein